MRKKILYSAMAVAITSSFAVFAGEHDPMAHQKHLASSQNDARELVHFPPEMRQHTLTNMRDHLQALSEILAALSGAHYDEAARIANGRLGMESPSAEGCKEANTTQSPTPPAAAAPVGMDHQMARFMPEGMRQIGLEMHRSASAFAVTATESAKTGDGTPTLAALAKVTHLCVACHVTYRLQ